MTAPDQVLISGVLQSGAVASIHLKGGTANGTGFLFEIHGTEGALAIAPADPRQATGTVNLVRLNAAGEVVVAREKLLADL